MSMSRRALALLVVTCVTAGCAIPRPIRATTPLTDDVVAARLEFLDTKIETERLYIDVWWQGWSVFYFLGGLVQATRAAIETSDAHRADLYISTGKAFFGAIVRVARRPKTIAGAEEVARLPESTVDERARKLAVAERVLLRNVKETRNRFNWLAHTTNVALNVAAGLVVWLGFHDGLLGLQSTLVGVGVGEVQILSQPWNALVDMRAYQARFGGMATTGGAGASPLAIGPALGSGRVSLFGFDLVR
jgi:hypothetical protein